MNNDIKILIAGEGGVGKSSLITRHFFNLFDEKEPLTKGVDLISKSYPLEDKDHKLRVIFYDLGGQERFQFLHALKGISGGSHGIIYLFSIEKPNSAENRMK